MLSVPIAAATVVLYLSILPSSVLHIFTCVVFFVFFFVVFCFLFLAVHGAPDVSRVALDGSLSELHTLYNQSLTRVGELSARGARGRGG